MYENKLDLETGFSLQWNKKENKVKQQDASSSERLWAKC